ncbi:DUF1134 domain-containing protein [Pelagerythrobacter marensis]|uniref:DUF1134 domain-containing protein n=1 Tax=Pelagerythrobacter marensis TaxID=543877 RepID=A0A0G3XBC4_9SPHN|nr:DUF1134 domain-containing protein [Pelagerythrobacter marensis]AKM07909.1 hypothetical protein AM2010_1846 [Pelagerythrobacter marensis]
MKIIPAIRGTLAMVAGAAALAVAPVGAQTIETFDPDTAIDGDLMERPGDQPVYAEPNTTDNGVVYSPTPPTDAPVAPTWSDPGTATSAAPATTGQGSANAQVASAQSDTYKEDDLIGAAEGVFGKGAEGVARMIEDLLDKQGEPNAYIVGREAGGAFVVGARYGSGTLYHKVEGERPVYWTGPSIGFDVGANAGNTFVLVYNLYDSEELYERYPAGEGQAYVVGGMTASYLRKGDVVLIPIRVGAGLRLGINAGYMKFSKKQRWLPF